MRLLFFCLFMICPSIVLAQAYETRDMQTGSKATVQLDLNANSTVQVDGAIIGITGSSSKGLIIENFPIGRHIIKAQQRGFSPQAWPVNIVKSTYIQLTSSENIPVDQSNSSDIRRSIDHSKSQLSLMQLNTNRRELAAKNKFTYPLGYHGWNVQGYPTVTKDSRYWPRKVDTKNLGGVTDSKLFEVFDEQGASHTLEFRSKYNGIISATTEHADKFMSIAKDNVLKCDITSDVSIKLDDQEVWRGGRRISDEIGRGSLSGSFSQWGALRTNVEKDAGLPVKRIEIYPVILEISNLGAPQIINYRGYVADNQLSDGELCKLGVGFFVEVSSAFK